MPNFYTRREPDEDPKCPYDYLQAYIISELSLEELSQLDKVHYPNCFIQQSSFKDFKWTEHYESPHIVQFI